MQGKVTIITGSAQGLGKAFAIRLLGAGAKVPYLILMLFETIGYQKKSFALSALSFQVCLSDVNTEVGEKTLVELKERFGEDKLAFIRCSHGMIMTLSLQSLHYSDPGVM